MIEECVQVGARKDHGKCSGKVTGDGEVTRDCDSIINGHNLSLFLVKHTLLNYLIDC